MNPARSVRLDKEASTRWKDPGKDPRGITKRDSTPDGYKEWGVRVCGDAVLPIFGAVLRKFHLKLRYCGFTKPSSFQN